MLCKRAHYQPEMLCSTISFILVSVVLKVILTGCCHPLQAWAPGIVFHDVQRYLILLPGSQASLPVRGLWPPQAFGDLFLIFFILKYRGTFVRPKEVPAPSFM